MDLKIVVRIVDENDDEATPGEEVTIFREMANMMMDSSFAVNGKTYYIDDVNVNEDD